MFGKSFNQFGTHRQVLRPNFQKSWRFGLFFTLSNLDNLKLGRYGPIFNSLEMQFLVGNRVDFDFFHTNVCSSRENPYRRETARHLAQSSLVLLHRKML